MIEYFRSGESTSGNGLDVFELFTRINGGERPPQWDEIRKKLVEDYIAKHPGARPFLWWRLDAPNVELVEHEELEPTVVMRRRIGGSGSLVGDPRWSFGVPRFVDAADPPRANDLPTFESQASFLRRHRLLRVSEKRRLKKRDFEPETVEIDPVALDGHEYKKEQS